MITSVIHSAKTYLSQLDEKRLKDAFEFANEAHKGQLRKDGTPYITHPVAAADILTGLRVDEDTLIACLLHDVPEDTTTTLKEIEVRFGDKVAFLVNGITKLSKVHYRNDMETRQIESLKKLFLHFAKDPRIILIKLADRLHNMTTIDAIEKSEKKIRIAKETLEIFVPIANLLGIWELKDQLEDHCFKALCPNEHEMIDGLVMKSKFQKSNLVNLTIAEISELLKEKNVNYISIEGRQKTYYGIYKKMLRTDKSFNEIYDLVGIRVIVEDLGTCYQALGVLHQNFTPKIGRLKDYIAIPKSNGYQSIHTTVFGIEGAITEFQVRTYDMHLENEFGIAAHYFYRELQEKQEMVKKKIEKKYLWVQKILDMQRDNKDNKKFMKNLKLDIFEDRIFVFTPKGDVIDLPEGANVIDFAYHIHSDIGMLAVSARINGKQSSLSKKLKSGDVVYIMTSEKSDGPQVNWLDIVITNLAKNKIREYLRENNRTSLIAQSEELLDGKLRLFGFDKGIKALNKLQRVMLMEHFALNSWEDVLYEIGKGSLDVSDLIEVLFTENELFGEEKAPNYESAYEHVRQKRPDKLRKPKKVHQVKWAMKIENRVGMLAEISIVIGNLGINIVEMNSASTNEPGIYNMDFCCEIQNIEQYEKAICELIQIPGVVFVKRHRIGKSDLKDSADSHKKLEQ